MDLYGDGGALRKSCVLGGWPVGLAIVGNLAWVGVSGVEREPHALPPHRGTTGKLVAVDLTTWQVVQEIPMPCAGIYDVLAV